MAITAGVRLRSSTGMTDSPSPGKGVGRTGRERTNTHHKALKLAGTGHLASFSVRRYRLYTRVTSATLHIKCNIAKLEAEGYVPFLELMFPPLPLSRSERAAR